MPAPDGGAVGPVAITGAIQKGPFAMGSEVVVAMLDPTTAEVRDAPSLLPMTLYALASFPSSGPREVHANALRGRLWAMLMPGRSSMARDRGGRRGLRGHRSPPASRSCAARAFPYTWRYVAAGRPSSG